MRLGITKKLGQRRYSFSFDGDTLFDCVMASQHILFPDVFVCGMCDSDDLEFRAYVTKQKGYQYVEISCNACLATLTLGKTRKEGAYFLRKNPDKTLEWRAYQPRNESDANDNPAISGGMNADSTAGLRSAHQNNQYKPRGK